MPYEVLPHSEEERAALTPFAAAILRQIEIRGNQNAPVVDRYSPQGIPESDTSWRFYENGRVEFGNLWQVHRVDVDDKELTFAYLPRTQYRTSEVDKFLSKAAGEEGPRDGKPQPVKSEFYVTEFDKYGAVARTCFSQIADEETIARHRVGRFRERQGSGLGPGVVQLSRPLSKRETKGLFEVLESPEDSIVALNGLMKVTKADQRAINKANKEHDKRQEELRKSLEDIDRCQREAWAKMMTDPTLIF